VGGTHDPARAGQRRGRADVRAQRQAVLGRAFAIRDGKIVECDFLVDPERLARLDLKVLDG
jgi:hypothetical protein